jgi:hypothetical protein
MGRIQVNQPPIRPAVKALGRNGSSAVGQSKARLPARTGRWFALSRFPKADISRTPALWLNPLKTSAVYGWTDVIIEGTGHEIQLDEPQAVIDAVDDVLRELQTGLNKLTRSEMYPHDRTAA